MTHEADGHPVQLEPSEVEKLELDTLYFTLLIYQFLNGSKN